MSIRPRDRITTGDRIPPPRPRQNPSYNSVRAQTAEFATLTIGGQPVVGGGGGDAGWTGPFTGSVDLIEDDGGDATLSNGVLRYWIGTPPNPNIADVRFDIDYDGSQELEVELVGFKVASGPEIVLSENVNAKKGQKVWITGIEQGGDDDLVLRFDLNTDETTNGEARFRYRILAYPLFD